MQTISWIGFLATASAMMALLLPSLWLHSPNFVKHVVARIFWPLLLDPSRYLQPYHLPLLPDVVSFRFFTHPAEDCIRISIVFQEITHDSPDILKWGTTPHRYYRWDSARSQQLGNSV